MQRRTFLKNTGLLSLGLSSMGFKAIKNWYAETHPLNVNNLAPVSAELEEAFNQLLLWLRENGWTKHLQNSLNVNLELSGEALKQELIKELDEAKLAALRSNRSSGYDDFSGERLIQPGFPAHSLLFHALASPRVRPGGVKDYPSLLQLDTLENYVYALLHWEDLKSIYGPLSDKNLVFAVFAYEYRPAFKTPHHAYADMVYSRTGMARIGNEPLHYDKLERCFTARPADAAKIKRVAVIPARYGLFIARKVTMNDISLTRSGTQKPKGADAKDDSNDAARFFLQPIRKVFDHDLLTGNTRIRFKENHESIKLVKLVQETKQKMYDAKPRPRRSEHLIEQSDTIRRAGSAFLVVSRYEELIRPAMEGKQVLFIRVPPEQEKPFPNRYFTAWATQLVEDVELLLEDNKAPVTRSYNKYGAPRNKPLFVNITNKMNQPGGTYSPLVKTYDQRFEQTINEGNYYAPLFEDSICDGRVEADISNLSLNNLPGISKKALPAFSVVTAPDFFPQVDPLDLAAYDIAPGTGGRESLFYEGGVASLATARIRPNPNMVDTRSEPATKETYLAVFSASLNKKRKPDPGKVAFYSNPAASRGYEISSFLPDVASSVFAPGWDVTYCGPEKDIYVGTEGLGSPFVEDMKFCSALNGMWPATSPDVARTYQGSNEALYRNPTAVPLLDHELGYCGAGPAGTENESWGWDGEQGPYLEMTGRKWKINFTDIGRADVVNNALDGLLDMSVLRTLTSGELIARMECLRLCIRSLPVLNFRETFRAQLTGYTYLWLVSAEKVNWGVTDAAGLNIPANLVEDKNEIVKTARVRGEGYLYVFANSETDHEVLKDWAPGLKRRRLYCTNIYVCQVTPTQIAWGEVKNGKINWH